MEMDLRRLQHFVTIARLRSYHRAAEHLHLSQPALSRSIQALEAQYQVRLFDRGRGGIELTSIGAQLLKRAEDLLHNAGSMEELLRGAAEGSMARSASASARSPPHACCRAS